MSAPSSPTAPQAAPPLGRWSHTWRFALCLLISATVWGTVERVPPALEILDGVLGVVAVVLAALRRRAPVTVMVLTGALSSWSTWAAGPATLAAVSLATRRRPREIVALVVVSLISVQLLTPLRPPTESAPFLVDLITDVVAISAMVGWGLFVGSRRELLANLRLRAERAEAEQELRTSQARLAERQRIAREMHDVLAHRITQISLRTGAMRFRDDLDAAALRAEAEVVEQVAHQALTDLRAVLGALRDTDASAPTAPQPTHGDLADLVADWRAEGLRVEAVLDLPDPGPDDAVGRTAYRIVQEGLTNARKHAPGAAVEVEVVGAPADGVSVTVRNPTGFAGSGTPGSGLGLTGLAERATLAAGWCRAGREGADFVLRAWLPWSP